MTEEKDVKVIEIREFLADSDLISNFYQVKRLITEFEKEISFLVSINSDDYLYLNNAICKMKNNLEKINSIIKLQN